MTTFNGNKNIYATDRAHRHSPSNHLSIRPGSARCHLIFLSIGQAPTRLFIKKFQDFSRTSTTFSQDFFIVQQCLNIQTNGSYLLYIHWVTVPTIAERSGWLVGWSLTSLFSRNTAISEMKGQRWWVILLSRTFQVLEILEIKIQDFPGGVGTDGQCKGSNAVPSGVWWWIKKGRGEKTDRNQCFVPSVLWLLRDRRTSSP